MPTEVAGVVANRLIVTYPLKGVVTGGLKALVIVIVLAPVLMAQLVPEGGLVPTVMIQAAPLDTDS